MKTLSMFMINYADRICDNVTDHLRRYGRLNEYDLAYLEASVWLRRAGALCGKAAR